MTILGEFFGYLAGICTAIAFLPQTLRTIKDKNVASLSLTSYVIYLTGFISWILYGVYLHSIQMIIFNLISLVFTTIILYLIIKNRKS